MRKFFSALCAVLGLAASHVSASTWTITAAVPLNVSSWVSNISHAVGITDRGWIVGNAESEPFVFDGSRFGYLQIMGGLNHPSVVGVTTDGWVFGTGSTTTSIPWGGNLETADWQAAGKIVVACCSIWNLPSPSSQVNGVSGVTAELLDFLSLNDLSLVAINPSGQIAANGHYGPSRSNVAFLLSPVNEVPVPPTLSTVLLGLMLFGVLRKKC